MTTKVPDRGRIMYRRSGKEVPIKNCWRSLAKHQDLNPVSAQLRIWLCGGEIFVARDSRVDPLQHCKEEDLGPQITGPRP